EDGARRLRDVQPSEDLLGALQLVLRGVDANPRDREAVQRGGLPGVALRERGGEAERLAQQRAPLWTLVRFALRALDQPAAAQRVSLGAGDLALLLAAGPHALALHQPVIFLEKSDRLIEAAELVRDARPVHPGALEVDAAGVDRRQLARDLAETAFTRPGIGLRTTLLEALLDE